MQKKKQESQLLGARKYLKHYGTMKEHCLTNFVNYFDGLDNLYLERNNEKL